MALFFASGHICASDLGRMERRDDRRVGTEARAGDSGASGAAFGIGDTEEHGSLSALAAACRADEWALVDDSPPVLRYEELAVAS